MSLRETFVVDGNGNPIAVQLPIRDYDRIREALEEFEDIKAYDRAKAKKEDTIPLRESIKLRRKKNA